MKNIYTNKPILCMLALCLLLTIAASSKSFAGCYDPPGTVTLIHNHKSLSMDFVTTSSTSCMGCKPGYYRYQAVDDNDRGRALSLLMAAMLSGKQIRAYVNDTTCVGNWNVTNASQVYMMTIQQ